MTTDIEEQLIAGMRQEVAGVTLTADLVGAAAHRHQRRNVLLRTTYTLGVLGVAGATAAVLTVGGAGPATTAERPPVAAAVAPEMKLAAAAAASENLSYRMRLTTGSGKSGLTYEGAFDPRTDTGYVRSPQDDSVVTELLIKGTRYVGGEAPLGPLPPDKGPGEKYGRYGQYPGKHDRLSLYGDGNSVLGAAAPDPAALYEALKKANATVTEKPDGTLHFEYVTKETDGSSTASGDITRDADGRISEVTMTGTWQSTAKGRLDQGTYEAAVKIFDYGVRVEVKRPADVVKAN